MWSGQRPTTPQWGKPRGPKITECVRGAYLRLRQASLKTIPAAKKPLVKILSLMSLSVLPLLILIKKLKISFLSFALWKCFKEHEYISFILSSEVHNDEASHFAGCWELCWVPFLTSKYLHLIKYPWMLRMGLTGKKTWLTRNFDRKQNTHFFNSGCYNPKPEPEQVTCPKKNRTYSPREVNCHLHHPGWTRNLIRVDRQTFHDATASVEFHWKNWGMIGRQQMYSE